MLPAIRDWACMYSPAREVQSKDVEPRTVPKGRRCTSKSTRVAPLESCVRGTLAAPHTYSMSRFLDSCVVSAQGWAARGWGEPSVGGLAVACAGAVGESTVALLDIETLVARPHNSGYFSGVHPGDN